MCDLKKYGCHPIVTIFPVVTEVFQLPEKGGMPHTFENLSMVTLDGDFLDYHFEICLLP
jgi:hypothetical protein